MLQVGTINCSMHFPSKHNNEEDLFSIETNNIQITLTSSITLFLYNTDTAEYPRCCYRLYTNVRVQAYIAFVIHERSVTILTNYPLGHIKYIMLILPFRKLGKIISILLQDSKASTLIRIIAVHKCVPI